MRKKLIILIFIIVLSTTSCINSYEQLTLFKRKILRTNLITQKFDNYDIETTVSQLLSSETRSAAYNFNKDTELIYDTIFIKTPSTVTYSFDSKGKISSIDFNFFFSKDNTEEEISDIYAECIKFFGYPDEGYTRAIYEYLYKSPSVLWIKNNALISLEFYLDDNLNAFGKMKYYRTEWNRNDLGTFKLPFTINALGDRIDTVVASESKKFSTYFDTTIGYTYKKDNLEWYKVNYIFDGQFLKEVDLSFIAHDLNEKQMETLIQDISQLMDGEFNTAAKIDKSDDDFVNFIYNGEATSISFIVDKNKANREIMLKIKFYEYVH